MVQLFRKNWFVFTLLLFPYALLTRIWAFFGIHSSVINQEEYSSTYTYFEQFFPESFIWNVILACVLIFFNAAQINHIVIKNRMSRELTLFPGMLFILFSALHKDMFTLSPQLISLTFILISVSNIFRIYHKPRAAVYIFNAGFFMGIANIFYPPFILFTLISFISILVLRKFRILDFIQWLIGYLSVFFFIAFFRFWKYGTISFLKDFYDQFDLTFQVKSLLLNEYVILAFILLLIMISLSNYRKFTIKKSIQSQKKVNLFYYFMFISLITILLGINYDLFPSLLTLIVALSFLISMIMSRSKNEAALELIHLFLLFFIIFSHFMF